MSSAVCLSRSSSSCSHFSPSVSCRLLIVRMVPAKVSSCVHTCSALRILPTSSAFAFSVSICCCVTACSLPYPSIAVRLFDFSSVAVLIQCSSSFFVCFSGPGN